MAFGSAAFHLVFFLFLLNFKLSPHFKEAPVYYVDLLTLPVASPQAGTPASAGPATPPPEQPAPAPRQEMALPQKPATRPSAKAPPAPVTPAESDREFADRIARLERENAAKHQAAALEALRNRATKGGRAGMPGATGNEAGSDYASFIQSRLRDAFISTIASQTNNPEVVLRITIGRTGRIERVKTERSTGDKVFEGAVARAVAKAEKTIPPPPKGERFEIGFVFRPQGVGKN